MSRYLRGKNGEFAGSVGTGKSSPPTPSDTPTPRPARAPVRRVDPADWARIKATLDRMTVHPAEDAGDGIDREG